ncbi:MAG: DUF2807 domain-containing protein [Chitinophagaceae bacterium]|nr:MAG: DUF2807 domain-containing protein [Chitinophagaceae bacterium]
MRILCSLFAVLLLASSCRFAGYHRVRGNGVLSKQERGLSNFQEVQVTGGMNVVLLQGAQAGVRVETDENLQEYVETEVNGNELHIHARPGYNLDERAGLTVYVTTASLRALTVTGSGDVSSQGKIAGDGLKIEVTGSGNVALALDMPSVEAQVTGSGTVRLSGNTRTFRSETHGSGEIHAFDLLAEDTRVEVSGSGDAEVFASKQLNVEVSGSGDVAYKGTANVQQQVHGSGSVHKAN